MLRAPGVLRIFPKFTAIASLPTGLTGFVDCSRSTRVNIHTWLSSRCERTWWNPSLEGGFTRQRKSATKAEVEGFFCLFFFCRRERESSWKLTKSVHSRDWWTLSLVLLWIRLNPEWDLSGNSFRSLGFYSLKYLLLFGIDSCDTLSLNLLILESFADFTCFFFCNSFVIVLSWLKKSLSFFLDFNLFVVFYLFLLCRIFLW